MHKAFAATFSPIHVAKMYSNYSNTTLCFFSDYNYHLNSTADKHRVQLKGVLPDYIHATFVNVFLVA